MTWIFEIENSQNSTKKKSPRFLYITLPPDNVCFFVLAYNRVLTAWFCKALWDGGELMSHTHTSWQLQGIVDWHFVLLPQVKATEKLPYLSHISPSWVHTEAGVLTTPCQKWPNCIEEKYWSLLCYLILVDCLLLFFTSGCVYLCSLLPRTFDRWVPILDFYLPGFSSYRL